MWNNAGNSLIVPAELAVNAVPNAAPLFTVVPGAGGVGKVNSLMISGNQWNMLFTCPELLSPSRRFKIQTLELRILMFVVLPMNNRERFYEPISNGFKHVFVGNKFTNANAYNGFHNWYQFLLEQRRNPTQTTNIAFNQLAFTGNRLPYFLRNLSFRWRGATKAPPGASSSMFVGTSPAFDLAMFTACVLRGRAPGGGVIGGNGKRVTDCECNILVPGGLPQSLVRFRTVEDPQYEQVVTAYPRSVQ
ncbi:uncharacterized protein LOC111325419 [Stylophora pistillata]|uniref:uncharacterized protein LOC111325419 n=1 Tax=Stylophora pistillata TaxID=50429 RepID=UPI000C03CDB7|nr:uncharacterized protein LOC111325419 [Stylophora pistillata]